MGAVVRRPLRQQAACPAQRPHPHPEQDPLRGAATLEGRTAEAAKARRLQGSRLPLQDDPRGLLKARAEETCHVHGSQRHSLVVDNRRGSIYAWQDRIRDPALTVLLVLEIGLIFVGAPLAARGVPIARPIIQTMMLAVVVIVGMLSHRRGAIAVILL